MFRYYLILFIKFGIIKATYIFEHSSGEIEDNKDITVARLAMIRAFSKIIASGLNILGVEPVNEM